MKKLLEIRFKPDKTTATAALFGVLAIISSVLLDYNHSMFFKFIFRDVLQMSIIGIAIPMIILAKNNEFESAGLRFDKAYKYILISIVLGALTSIGFHIENCMYSE